MRLLGKLRLRFTCVSLQTNEIFGGLLMDASSKVPRFVAVVLGLSFSSAVTVALEHCEQVK